MNTEKKLTELKRDAIIEAAVYEFRSNGFHATNMDRIAETAQVSKRTIYNHFESKEILFQCITQELCDRATQVSSYLYDTHTPIKNQLTAIAEQEIALLASEEFLSTLRMITAESLASPELTKTNVDNFQENSIGVVKWIRQANKDGKLSISDPVRAGQQFLALIEGFALWPQLYGLKPIPKKKEQQNIIDSAVDMFLNTYETCE